MKKFLKAVKHWAGFLSVGKTKRRIWKFPFQFGDWCAPYGTSKEWMGKGKWVATAYWANSCAIAAKAAEILGKPKDAAHYKKLRREVCNAYRKEFTDGKGRLLEEFQTGYVLPIYFDMFSEREKAFAAGQLDKLVKAADHHLDTGFTGTPYLLFALSDNGYLDEAYRVLLQDTCPSWLYEIRRHHALGTLGCAAAGRYRQPRQRLGGRRRVGRRHGQFQSLCLRCRRGLDVSAHSRHRTACGRI